MRKLINIEEVEKNMKMGCVEAKKRKERENGEDMCRE